MVSGHVPSAYLPETTSAPAALSEFDFARPYLHLNLVDDGDDESSGDLDDTDC